MFEYLNMMIILLYDSVKAGVSYWFCAANLHYRFISPVGTAIEIP